METETGWNRHEQTSSRIHTCPAQPSKSTMMQKLVFLRRPRYECYAAMKAQTRRHMERGRQKRSRKRK